MKIQENEQKIHINKKYKQTMKQYKKMKHRKMNYKIIKKHKQYGIYRKLSFEE